MSAVILVNIAPPLQGQILANLKAMDSDWFAQNYMGRKSKVRHGQDAFVFSFNFRTD